MNNLRCASACLRVLVASVCFSVVLAEAQTKSIQLRNETIVTSPRGIGAGAARASANEAAVSGLYWIQFEGRPQQAWRDQLRGLGVELLHYVPEDAFLARMVTEGRLVYEFSPVKVYGTA